MAVVELALVFTTPLPDQLYDAPAPALGTINDTLPPTSIVAGKAVRVAKGLVQTPGTVVITEDSALTLVLSVSHEHLVLILWAGPVCA